MNRLRSSFQETYYYTRDHLGSIREMLNSSGTILTRYTYDPYGKQTTNYLSGSVDATFRYTGDYYHQTSGLSMPQFRAYDSNTGRWLSRDPLPNVEKVQGPNLYEYVWNDPLYYNDPTGLKVYRCCHNIEGDGLLVSMGTACGFQHCWIKTDTMEAGMGDAENPNGPLPAQPFFRKTKVTDHTGLAKSDPSTVCTEIKNVDETCVNREIQIGTSTGRWLGGLNNCNTFTDEVFVHCRACKPSSGRR